MRVLFITGEFPPMQGGVGDCTNEIAKGLAALGMEVRVLTSQAASRQQPAGRSQLPITNYQLTILPNISKWNWSSLRVITNTVREFAPDIVHIQYQTGAFGMHPAINFLPRVLTSHPLRPLSPLQAELRQERGEGVGGSGMRLVTTFHDLRVPYLFPKARRVREWVTRELARSSDAVIATNAADYFSLLTLNLKLAALIPIGTNISTTPPPNYPRATWRAQLGVAENETLLCYFGFLNESKGGETLIRALAQIPGVKLLMIGGQTGASDPTNIAYLAKVNALIADLGLTDRVLWTDYTPPEIVTANFLASDICVLPYRDGASYRRGTLMAALAHAMPIVTTSPPSPMPPSPSPDAIHQERGKGVDGLGVRLPALRDGDNCLLVAPDNPRALAEAVQRAAGSPDLRAKISAGARELAQHFTWNKIARQHLELYDQLCRAK